MVTTLAARWLLTAVFASAGLRAALPWHATAGPAQPAARVPVVFCAAMCAALTAMTWRSEPAAATWLQTGLFGFAALWFGLARLAGSRRTGPGLPALLHALMAGAMIWMLTVIPAVTGMPPPGHGRGAMTAMSPAATPVPLLAVSILLAMSCAAASIPWLALAIGPGPRVKDPLAASQAAMSAGMAAMLLTTP